MHDVYEGRQPDTKHSKNTKFGCRATSLIRSRHPPKDLHRALVIGLPQGPTGRRIPLSEVPLELKDFFTAIAETDGRGNLYGFCRGLIDGWPALRVQGYLAHKKPPPPRTLHQHHA